MTDMISQAEQVSTPLLADLVAKHARHTPDRVAVIQGEASQTYAQLDAYSDRVAAALQREGAPTGGVVVVCASSSAAYIAVFLGVLRAGLAIAPLSPSSSSDQLAAMIADSGAHHLFLDASTSMALEHAPTGVRRIALDGSSGGDPFSEWLEPQGSHPGPWR